MSQFYPYRLHLEADPDGGYVVTSPDVPELVTQGESAKDAIEAANNALVAALLGYMRQRRAFPVPTKDPGEDTVSIHFPELVQAKVLLYNTMIEKGMSNSELSRRLGKKSENQVRRMLDPRKNVNFGDISKAFSIFHLRLSMVVEHTAKDNSILPLYLKENTVNLSPKGIY